MRLNMLRFVCLVGALAAASHAQTTTPLVGASSVTPSSGPAGQGTVVTFTTMITSTNVMAESVLLQRYDEAGKVIATVGNLRDDGLNGDQNSGDGRFTLVTTVFGDTPGSLIFRVSAAFRGSLVRQFSAPFSFIVEGTTPTGIVISTPANLTFVNTSPQVIRGTVGDPAATIKVNGVTAQVTTSPGIPGGSWMATVPLIEGNNPVTAVATNSNNTVSTASITVNLDTTPPRAQITFPENNSTTSAASTSVAGIVNDVVVGTVNDQQVTITVNGANAQVQNRTFSANVNLNVGANVIQVVARDRVGNIFNTSVTVTRSATPPNNQQAPNLLTLVSGNGQQATIGTAVPLPLTARLTNLQGQPLANSPVVFRVEQNDALLRTAAGALPNPSIIVNTNAQGVATALLTVGTRAGLNNNRVEVDAAGAANTLTFLASSVANRAAAIVVDSGNLQTGVIGQALPFPFIAVVTDSGHNRLRNIPVTFTVKAGGATINGAPTFTTNTDSDGRALAVLTLGFEPGNSNVVVEANFAGNAALPAIFTASSKAPGNPAETTVSGVVLDNANRPLQNVTVRLLQAYQGNQNNLPVELGRATTNAAGAFSIANAPAGTYKLLADGSTAGNYPPLEYDIFVIAGQDNTVGSPIYLPVLDQVNRVCVTSTTGGTLNLPQVPGFQLTIAPGSATFPGGSRTGCVSVSVVNPDKVPMAPGFGQQPRFIVTVQPVGTHFNPPAAITIPNVDGLPPGAITEMYSYDHDLAAFTAIGTATVTPDGSQIASDAGVGIIKAGWHCGGNPNQAGSAGSCPQCQKCQGSSCVTDDGGNCDDGKFCTSCNGGTAPGADCCKGGSCTGKKLMDQDVVGGALQEWDFTKLSQILNGTAKAFSLAPGCKAPSPSISGAIKMGLVKSCCDARQSFVDVTKFTGEIALKSGVGIECLVPGLSFNVLGIFQAGVKVGITLGGSFSGSGYGSNDDQCLKCAWSVDGKIVATVTGSLVAVTALDPDMIRFEGGVKGEGSVGASIKCDTVSAKGCLGPVKVFGQAILGNFLKKSVDFTIPGTQVCYP